MKKVEGETADLYDDLWADIGEKEFKRYRKRLTTILPEHFYTEKICLDAGCGQGAISSIISEKAKKLYSIDIGEKALESTKKNILNTNNVVFKKASLLNIPFEDNSFDFIVSNGVIHHTPNPKRALDELRRVLKPEGELLLGIYGKKGILRHFIELTRVLLKWIPYKNLKKTLIRLGFNPLTRYYLLDYIYVPIRKRISIKEMKNMMDNFSEFRITSDYPKGKINKFIYGTNYYYISAKKNNKIYK